MTVFSNQKQKGKTVEQLMENIKEIEHIVVQVALVDTVVLSIQIYLLDNFVQLSTQSNLNAWLHGLILHRPLLQIISISFSQNQKESSRNGKLPLRTFCLWSLEF